MSRLPSITPVTPSVRSDRSAKPLAVPPEVLAASNASQRSVAAASNRSGAGSTRSGVPAVAASERSHRSQGSAGSISSSVALGKLAQLEKMLLEERRAREEAENTMLALQRERIAKDEATRKFEATERQLAAVMEAVKGVVSNPENPGNIRKLKTILTGVSDTSQAADPVATNSDGRPRSFLDAVGQYERDRERARKAQLVKKS